MFCFGAKVSKEFASKVCQICHDLGWSPAHANWLMACMAFETGETFSPSIKNAAGSGATGLIQFMPATARDLGTSVAELTTMSAVKQLDYVAKYFKPYANRINSLADMYMAILMPKYINGGLDATLFKEGTKSYSQNKGLDKDKNGIVSKRESSSKVQAKLDKGLQQAFSTHIIPWPIKVVGYDY